MKFIDLISVLPTNPDNPYRKRDLSKVDTIVIHQTDGSDRGIESVYSAANYHVDTKGWGGIAYHVFITDDGKIYQTNTLDTLSYHAAGYNTRSVGIAITGKHRYETGKTNEEIIGKVKYKALVDSIVKTLSLLPNNNIKIVSHEDISSIGRTDPNLDMNQLRKDVKKKKSSSSASDSNSHSSNSDSSSCMENIETIKTHLKTIHDLTKKIEELL